MLGSSPMSDSKRVTCGEHGETPATFACRHLTRGVACGYHASADDPGDQWPDAWCDLCEDAFQAEGGEWNDVSEKVADIKLMCTGCYDAARMRNAQPPRLARGARAQLSATEAAALFHHATHEMQAAQEASQKRWGWNAMAGWNFDDKAGTLTFSDPSRPSIVADVRLVGSYSTKSNTFQWAWQTFDECAPEAHEIARLRIFGEVRGVAKLTTATLKCDEAEGWEMASLAGYVLGTEAMYRAPFHHQRWFMLLSNLRHTN
jgi:hypothetical protein